MAPSTLDLLVLTFNCAKNLISPGIFASHLQSAFAQNATGLPDLVVLSLQEIAPLSQAFIGDYFLNPYFARFDEAVNLAAIRDRQYKLIKAHNVGYTAIMLFAKDPARLRDLREAEVGFGAADMGNKGAVGLRALYQVGDGERSTELTFVATHLAAMEWNLPRRNANWAAIMRGLTFENPEEVLDKVRSSEGASTPESSEGDAAQERHHLLQDEHHKQHLELRRQLHDISVFKSSSHLFVAGDLNYRISTTSPPPNAAFPSLDPESEHHYPNFFPLDQLTRERAAGRTLHGLTEHEVRFPPTYKYIARPPVGGQTKDAEETEVRWKFAPHRYPSWTDRILYLDVPTWVGSHGDAPRVNVRAYDAMPVVRTSDHRPVFLRVDVPLISPGDLAPPASLQSNETDAATDPRLRLPVEIDPEAWERRKAARQKEQLVGWSMFLWSTKEGAWILATLLLAGLGGYWYYQTAK
ncbi:endonuclease/Exonuclease/phosphatase family domain-containing protein [Hirsutella rhossiliensis]|uniref:Endonuclease/Exonuclease/phosphatase family domain-containing protein n=1 Tax=Hirsutella rhossiliensis TaxID=111463 RepID=A0A9P8MXE2_9HYPO|nr:endonuclease/Exonuclease/phosphatase family domain-containing protein [Hirsutella rhossiliensis]KAH0964073.1 endonuclease/Exonuclease/phosphatase family domain-containing protein [Hirsutella rhossiliensis]